MIRITNEGDADVEISSETFPVIFTLNPGETRIFDDQYSRARSKSGEKVMIKVETGPSFD